jgi:hypothetical protein
MAYAFVQDVPIDQETYEGITAKLDRGPMPGLLMHLCIRREDGGLRYIDVWESEEACGRTFDEYVHPAVYATFKETGFMPDGEPAKTDVEVLDLRIGPDARP